MFNNGLYPYMNYGSKAGLFSAFKKINWGNFLTNTQKTLGVINQAIPIAYQVKPIWNNAKTMFRIMGAIKDDGKQTQVSKNNNSNTLNNSNELNNTSTNQYNFQSDINQPNFFL